MLPWVGGGTGGRLDAELSEGRVMVVVRLEWVVRRCVLLMVDRGLNASRFLRGFSVRRQRHYRM